VSERLQARLDAFTYHRPSPAVQALMASLRGSYQVLACLLDKDIPACREQSLAFTALEESAMWAMKALALTDPGGVVVDPSPERG
jgi:hypothetical protein